MGSDLLSNALRGRFAEYIIGLAVDASSVVARDGTREEWDTFDLETESKIKIEVKSAAYLQTWRQKTLSSIRFGIAPTAGWDYVKDERLSERSRWADVYVFCLLNHKDKGTVNPLDMEQWTFYVLATSVLNERVGEQKTIGLRSLKQLRAEEVSFDGIVGAVERADRVRNGFSGTATG